MAVAAPSHAQAPQADPAVGFSQAELQALAAQNSTEADASAPETSSAGPNFLSLLIDGGWLMLPIGLMSLLVVAITLERFFTLRSSNLLPGAVRREIRSSLDQPPEASMAVLFRTAQNKNSTASRMLRDIVLKAGRPIPEIENTLAESAQREADYMYGNVRWLSLAAAVTPLIGLLGTVWGMIMAFYETTQLGSGANRAEELAGGIYVALVTTLGGLAVAIPAAVFAHYFEGRITRALAKIDASLRSLLPLLEDLEGKGRFSPRTQTFESSNAHPGGRAQRTPSTSAAGGPAPKLTPHRDAPANR
ncbi:MAG TPA: MotA/TolQ/ExbB proton channel family protein [Planctomycetaceae bacterium]|nr:MotA/TolQ/ExbB proton channel family protein [Planctomycetaceae bacterium]